VTTEYRDVPQVLAVVLAQAARFIARGPQDVDAFHAVGVPGQSFNYADILNEYGPESMLLLQAWVELETQRIWSLRPVEPSLVRQFDFSGAAAVLTVGVCRFARPDARLLVVHPDEPVYCLSASPGVSDGIDVRRLRLF